MESGVAYRPHFFENNHPKVISSSFTFRVRFFAFGAPNSEATVHNCYCDDLCSETRVNDCCSQCWRQQSATCSHHDALKTRFGQRGRTLGRIGTDLSGFSGAAPTFYLVLPKGRALQASDAVQHATVAGAEEDSPWSRLEGLMNPFLDVARSKLVSFAGAESNSNDVCLNEWEHADQHQEGCASHSVLDLLDPLGRVLHLHNITFDHRANTIYFIEGIMAAYGEIEPCWKNSGRRFWSSCYVVRHEVDGMTGSETCQAAGRSFHWRTRIRLRRGVSRGASGERLVDDRCTADDCGA